MKKDKKNKSTWKHSRYTIAFCESEKVFNVYREKEKKKAFKLLRQAKNYVLSSSMDDGEYENFCSGEMK